MFFLVDLDFGTWIYDLVDLFVLANLLTPPTLKRPLGKSQMEEFSTQNDRVKWWVDFKK